MRLEEREMDICEYLEHPFENALLLDVRSKTMFSFGSLPDAVNLPVDEIGSLYELPRAERSVCFVRRGRSAGRLRSFCWMQAMTHTIWPADTGNIYRRSSDRRCMKSHRRRCPNESRIL